MNYLLTYTHCKITIMNTQQLIRDGLLKHAKYMIIACDGRSCDDYPVYCYSTQEVKNKLATEFNFFNLECKTHHGVIDLDEYNKNHVVNQPKVKKQKNQETYGTDGKIRKYRHMQLRTLKH